MSAGGYRCTGCGRGPDEVALHRTSPKGGPFIGACTACLGGEPRPGDTFEQRLADALEPAVDTRCCDMHNQHCEAPSELCCRRCSEASHIGLFPHSDGSPCVLARPVTPEERQP